MKIYAVKLDVVSIQKYIFEGNKLTQYLGASYLISDKIFGDFLKNAVKNTFKNELDFQLKLDLWEKEMNILQIESQPFEIIYIGGGNALLFFQKQDHAKDFIYSWTCSLLVNTPGLTSSVAILEFNLDDIKNNFKNIFKSISKKLQQNQQMHIPETNIFGHGITSNCNQTGLSVEAYIQGDDSIDFLSACSFEKNMASKKAIEAADIKYNKILIDEYYFPKELSNMGQVKNEDSRIAIIHIDGNDIGNLFNDIDNYKDLRLLSKEIRNAANKSFENLLVHIIDNYDTIKNSLDNKNENTDNKNNKKNLFLRPVIIGGDDITFVSEGRLGIYFAQKYLKFFEKQKLSCNKKLTACAGVAIVNAKYPFYRAYQLAEELCKNAKKIRYENIEKGLSSHSYIDFHISSTGLSGGLKHIRKQYSIADNKKENQIKETKKSASLIFRPYKINANNDIYDFDLLIKNTLVLKNLPENKINKLRKVLNLTKDESEKFCVDLKYRELLLPEIKGFQYKYLGKNDITPYFDMIEISDIYPDFIWTNNGEDLFDTIVK